MENHQNSDYASVIDTLFNTFSGILEKDVIAAVVESYEGDLNQSANALMNISGDLNPVNSGQPPHIHYVQNPPPAVMSYAHASQAPPPVAAKQIQVQNPPQKKIISNTQWNDQIREVIANYNHGWRVLVLMRGVPGSGKSFLSQEILQMTVGVVKNDQIHIMSTDDYFFKRGVYRHEKSKLPDAHSWNQQRAQDAMKKGVSPIIIDNTNVEIWEMEPYVRAGVSNGYIITVVEPQTPWARKANQLYKKNIHNVPFPTIKRMLDNYQNGITGEMLVYYCGIRYPANLTPPVFRNYPPLPQISEDNIMDKDNMSANDNFSQNEEVENTNSQTSNNSEQISSIENQNETRLDESVQNIQPADQTNAPCLEDGDTDTGNTGDEKDDFIKQNYAELEKCIEKFNQVETAWDNGESWEDNVEKEPSVATTQPSSEETSKPQRNRETVANPLIPFIPTEDWSKLSVFPTTSARTLVSEEVNTPVIEKKSSYTCIEIEDTNGKNSYKEIKATPRDINIFIPSRIEKIPDQRMLDKSTQTTDDTEILMKPLRCINAEQHFRAFRRMFSHLPSAALRDIFENCCGDVNWAVGIVMDGMENKNYNNTQNEEISDDEEDDKNTENCNCLAAYCIIPDNRSYKAEKAIPSLEKVNTETSAPYASPKKIRVENSASDCFIEIKRQIENNIVISDNHYSEHCLKLRKFRRREQKESEDVGENNEDKRKIESSKQKSMYGIEFSIDETNEIESKEGNYSQPDQDGNINQINNEIFVDSEIKCESGDSAKNKDIYESDTNLPSTSGKTFYDMKHDDESDCDDDVEKTVNITIGNEFLKQLDQYFGRNDMRYPENVSPKINIPMSLLSQLNALWLESLTHQLDQDSKQTEAMIQQDAEFARELAQKEEELLLAGKESQMPDFKEIMDLDYALSLYQREVEELRNNEPLTMAAKLTRDKLFNLFPSVSSNLLSELLMAHNNNFEETVKGVLLSIGRNDILAQQNGVARFIMTTELKERSKLLEAQNKALAEVEWPLLPRKNDLTMEDVDYYREQAERHYTMRRKNYQKAKDYMNRGIIQAASFFSCAGAFHTRLYEQNHSKAAVTLAEVNARNCDNATIDLHNLRVRESMESLDIFIDIHITKLREINGVRWQTLFFITGRGLHSSGDAKIKPACKKRLKERGLSPYEMNPGLLAARVSIHNKLSEEIS